MQFGALAEQLGKALFVRAFPTWRFPIGLIREKLGPTSRGQSQRTLQTYYRTLVWARQEGSKGIFAVRSLDARIGLMNQGKAPMKEAQ